MYQYKHNFKMFMFSLLSLLSISFVVYPSFLDPFIYKNVGNCLPRKIHSAGCSKIKLPSNVTAEFCEEELDINRYWWILTVIQNVCCQSAETLILTEKAYYFQQFQNCHRSRILFVFKDGNIWVSYFHLV